MRRTCLALTVATGLLVAAPSAGAAGGRPLVVTDVTGDANGINGQSLGLPVPGVKTSPANVKGADLRSLTLATVFAGSGRTRKPTGMTVTLKLGGPLQTGVNYGVIMDSSKPCGQSSRIQLGYQVTPALTSSLAICQSAGTGGDSTSIGGVTVNAAKGLLTWFVDGSALPKGSVLSGLSASSSVFVLGVFDEVVTGKTFAYGS